MRLGEIEAAEVITTREFAHRREGERGTIANSAVSTPVERASASRRKKVRYVEEKEEEEAPIKSIFRGSFVLGAGTRRT